MINPNFNNINNNINSNNNNIKINNNNINNANDNSKIKIDFLLNQKQLNINSNSQEKVSNVKEKKNQLTKSSNPIVIKKTKDQKKIQSEHLQSNVRCKKCNELPSFKHDNKRWYCKYCEKPFTPISFKNLTKDNFPK
ncbi:hypothetical protein ACTFIV_002388 [Dictyostelium citrinum]